jgi:hypothetical protein
MPVKKTSAKKTAHKKASTKSRSRKPVDLQAIRESITNLVGVEALDICSALAEEAKKGELAPAKFLFEMSGLYPVSVTAGADDDPDAESEDGNDLARVLLQRLALPVETPEEDGQLATANVATDNSVE